MSRCRHRLIIAVGNCEVRISCFLHALSYLITFALPPKHGGQHCSSDVDNWNNTNAFIL